MNDLFVYLLVFAAAALLLRYPRLAIGNGLPLPPGPMGDPFVGHLRVMPAKFQHLTFFEWGKKYGDVIYTKIFHKNFVILNSFAAAKELLDVRGSNTSYRPNFPFVCDLMGFGSNLVLLQYGSRWRKQRRMLSKSFNSRAVLQFRPVEQYFVNVFLNDLLEDPAHYRKHVEKAVASTIVMLTYGVHVKSKEDRLVSLSEKVTTLAVESASSPGAAIIDLIPILKHVPPWFPGAKPQKYAAMARGIVQESMDYPFGLTKTSVERGNARRSVVANLINDPPPWNEDEDGEYENEIKNVGSVLYMAGVETTVTSTLTFILAMLLHPNAQQKAQEEIDRVVGPNRLPNFSDRKDLPYVGAVFKETLRWHVPVALGILHCPYTDEEYNGYNIPAGTTIIPNIWAMSQNEDVFEEPRLFKPERYLKTSDKSSVYDTTAHVFGFGRRVCPGRFFADDSVWLNVACILATFNIEPELDDKGRPIHVEPKFKHGSSSPPEEFPCRMRPRSEKAATLIRKYMPAEEP